jgi:hypothetical protein
MNKSLKIEVPQTLGAIKLREYQKYLKIVDKNKDAESPDLVNMKALEIFCGISLKEAYGLKLTDFNFLVEHLNNLFNHKTPLVQRFTLKGSDGVEVEFGFMPKLEDITAGEFIDLDNYIGDWNNMHRAMAVLYRPVTFEKKGRYLIEPYEGSDKYSEIMEDAPVDIAIGAMVFFYHLGSELSRRMIVSLEKEMQSPQITPLKRTLEENGVGITQFTQSLKAMRQSLTRLRSYGLPNS